MGGGGGDEPPSSKTEDDDDDDEEEEEDEEVDEEKLLEARRKAELDRLHRLGIPVPGVAIRVDKTVATVWLENLDIECSSKLLADRVRVVIDRAIEVTAPLWG